MIISKRTKATIISVIAFAAALLIYLATRPDRQVSTGAPTAAGDPESVNQGRALGSKLAALAGKSPTPAPAAEPPTHTAGPVCDKCTTENCVAGTDDGCDSISDAADRKLCEDLYACFADAKNDCVIQGDPLRCWCGTNMLTCVTDNSGPTRANGPCAQQVFAAAKTSDADTIFRQFLNAELPLGRAARVTACRGTFCSNDCKIR